MESELYSSQAAIEIPDDLWIEILARVPGNLVLKFRCLSKFHRDLINSSNFIEKHSNLLDKTSSSCSYVLCSSFTNNYWVKKVNLTDSDAIVLHTCIPPQGNYKWVGCCKGILLLQSPESIMLWNPLTGASRSLPHVDNEDISYFLGQDEVTADLKILKVVHGDVSLAETNCEIYSWKSDCWREIIETNHHLKLQSITYFKGVTFVEGTNSAHMLAIESETGDLIIAAFDFSAEKFSWVFHLPPEASGHVFISSLDGCLCVSIMPHVGVLKVWMMKEYGVMESWALVLDLQTDYCFCFHFMQLDGWQILLLTSSGVQLYDVEEKKLKKKKVSFVEPGPVGLLNRCVVYTPSLRRV